MKKMLFNVLAIAVFLITSEVGAVQHLVQPGSDWGDLDERIQPGDSILLLPGTHRPARFSNMQGTRKQPIVIQSLDPERPAVIANGRHGIRLDNPRHVRIDNIIISECSANGITIYDSQALDREPSEAGDDQPKDIIIKNVRIERIGPKSRCNGVQAHGVSQFHMKNCEFEGWGSAAIELVGCTDVTIDTVQCVGSDEFLQAHGVIARGGTSRLNIRACRFENAGATAIRLGGTNDLQQMRQDLPLDVAKRSVCEADSVNISRCLAVNSPTLLHISHGGRIRLANCTATGAGAPVILVTLEHADDRLKLLGEFRIVRCLFAWETAMVPGFVQMAGDIDDKAVRWESNFWWSADDAETRATLVSGLSGQLAMPDVTDIDPQFDENWKPGVRKAELYGWSAP